MAQQYREAFQINKRQNLGFTLNKDTGNFIISDSCLSFLKPKADNLLTPEINPALRSHSENDTRFQPLDPRSLDPKMGRIVLLW